MFPNKSWKFGGYWNCQRAQCQSERVSSPYNEFGSKPPSTRRRVLAHFPSCRSDRVWQYSTCLGRWRLSDVHDETRTCHSGARGSCELATWDQEKMFAEVDITSSSGESLTRLQTGARSNHRAAARCGNSAARGRTRNDLAGRITREFWLVIDR